MQPHTAQHSNLAPRNSSQSAHHGVGFIISAWLLAALGCGQAPPDSIEQATPNTPSSTSSTTPSHMGHQFPADTSVSLKSTPRSDRTPTGPVSDAARATPNGSELAAAASQQQWFAEARIHPEVTVRRQALELWALQQTEGLDPVMYALVDEDETIRARAQGLYEQQLARDAAETHPAAPVNKEDAGPTLHAEGGLIEKDLLH